MAEKDVNEKLLEDYNDVFADIVNGLLFGGERKILEDQLENMHVVSQYKAETGRLHQEERDAIKKWHDGVINIAVLGIENQSDTFKYMPLRIIGYDGAAYRSQLLRYTRERKTKRNRRNINKNKRKQFIPVPVVSLILYFGNRRWNKNLHLREVVKIPQELDPYVSDYRINVFEIAWLSDEQIACFISDFRIVANFFVRKRENPDYVPDDPTDIEHVDEVLKLLSVITGDDRYERVCNTKEGKVKKYVRGCGKT